MVLTNLSWFKVSLLAFVYWLLIALIYGVVGYLTGDTRYSMALLLLAMIVPAMVSLRRDRSELKLWLMMTASMALSILSLLVWVALSEMPR
jgi:TctA family transporter